MGVMSDIFGVRYADDVALLAQNAMQYAGSMQKEFDAWTPVGAGFKPAPTRRAVSVGAWTPILQ
jgi:hypothetical protein